MSNAIEAIVTLVAVYLFADFFFLDFGILNPAILTRIAEVLG